MVNELRLDIPSMNLMEYISVIESIYITEPTPTHNLEVLGSSPRWPTTNERVKHLEIKCLTLFFFCMA